MGVHGNGLTSLLWMKRSPRTTVMEFFYPGGFTRDYQNTAYSLGISYYGWWGNMYVFTEKGISFPCISLTVRAPLIPSSFFAQVVYQREFTSQGVPRWIPGKRNTD